MMLGPEQRWDEFLGESRFMEGAVGWGREIALCQHLASIVVQTKWPVNG